MSNIRPRYPNSHYSHHSYQFPRYYYYRYVFLAVWILIGHSWAGYRSGCSAFHPASHIWVAHPALTVPTTSSSFSVRGRSVVSSFLGRESPAKRTTSYRTQVALASRNNNQDDDETTKQASGRGGYKFGDISRGLLQRGKEQVNTLTGKDHYEFGDLSKYFDERAKSRISSARGGGDALNGTEVYQYQWGDITLWADNLAKEKAAQFAGKQNASDYEFGDISQTIVQKVQSGEYDVADVFLAFRVLVSAGFVITPLASIVPMKGLIAMINFGLRQEVSGKVVGVLAGALDTRVQQALSSGGGVISAKLGSMATRKLVGDVTKEKLEQSIQQFTGQKRYEFGDLASRISKLKNQPIKQSKQIEWSPSLLEQLSEWDAQFLSSTHRKNKH